MTLISGVDPARWWRLGLRARIILLFGLVAGLVALTLTVSVFFISRGYMLDQRARSAVRQADAHVELVRNVLAGRSSDPARVLTQLNPPVDTLVLLKWNNHWFASTPGLGPESLPTDLDRVLESSDAIVTKYRGRQMLAVGVDVDTTGNALFEFAPMAELQSTLGVLRSVLIVCGICATAAGGLLGWWASRRVVTPLHQLADTAGQISSGSLQSRLPDTADRDLAPIVTSFNTMVDSLQARIDRERQLFGDVSHELRTPLTTLMASVDVVNRSRDHLPQRSQHAVDLIAAELSHMRRVLEDLLDLARSQAGLYPDQLDPIDIADLVHYTLADSHRTTINPIINADAVVLGRKVALERALLNLMDNADNHGHGLTAITIDSDSAAATVTIHIDDAGPGVTPADRSRIFERFVTAHAGRRTAFGPGTGLGLALVAEIAAAHHGTVSCTANPVRPGTRFSLTLPIAENLA